jgi:hypothetical protein
MSSMLADGEGIRGIVCYRRSRNEQDKYARDDTSEYYRNDQN